MQLPILATAEDAIEITKYLNTKATGCTIEDAKTIVDKRLLDPRKITAYKSWGIISNDGAKIKLTETGKRLARSIDKDYPDVFRIILQSIDAYHSALEWVFYKKDFVSVTNVDIAAYWYENKKFGLSDTAENTLKDMAVCYFRICEAAAMGKMIVGRKGQSTRLEINRDELGQYIGGSTLSRNVDSRLEVMTEVETNTVSDYSTNSDITVSDSTDEKVSVETEEVRIFISHGNNMEIVEQIKTLIELANFDYEIAIENETSAIPIPEKVFGAMRRCNSAVICVSADEKEKKEDGQYGINQNVLIEIGSAFVLYDKKVILVWDKRIDIPSNLQGLYRCEFSGDELSWGTGIKLMKALNNFKKK